MLYYKMPLPHDGMTLAQLKAYVRSHNLNKPEIKLSMKKADLIKGLKKHGHWESGMAPGGPKSLRKPKLPPRPKAMASQKTKGQQLKERAMKMKADREKPRSQRGY